MTQQGRPTEYVPLFTEGGGDPTYAEVDAFLRAHFGARAVRASAAEKPERAARPREVTVLGHRLELVVAPPKEDPLGERTLVGRVDVDAGKIWLADGQGHSPYTEKDTVLHEVVHAVLALTKMDQVLKEEEERLTSVLATILLDTLRRNPETTRWLVEEEDR